MEEYRESLLKIKDILNECPKDPELKEIYEEFKKVFTGAAESYKTIKPFPWPKKKIDETPGD